MKGILFAELVVEIPFHDVDSMGYDRWHGNSLPVTHLNITRRVS
ncbi:hypothetical protein [Shewanella halifaxensis]